MSPPRPRSVYADRLSAYAAFALGDDAIYARRGHWRAFFGERIGPAFDGRLVLEIGCSDGAFLATLAAKHPTTGFVGLDWKHKSLFIAAGRVDASGLRNIGLLRGRGQDVADVFGDSELDEILVLHPDPFATPAEWPNRLIAEPFLIDAHHTLNGPAAALTLKTDHPGYYGWVLALLGLAEPAHFNTARARAIATPTLANRLDGDPRIRAADLMPVTDPVPRSQPVIDRFDVAAHSFDYWHDPAALAHTAGRPFADERTFFEDRFLKKRQPIYYVELRKRGGDTA